MPRKTHVKCKFRLSKRKLKKLKIQTTRHNIAEKENAYKRSNYSQRAKTKHALIDKYGTFCWLCHLDFGKKITHHHILFKSQGGDDSYENGSLLCEKCQKYLHSLPLDSKELKNATKKIIEKKRWG